MRIVSMVITGAGSAWLASFLKDRYGLPVEVTLLLVAFLMFVGFVQGHAFARREAAKGLPLAKAAPGR